MSEHTKIDTPADVHIEDCPVCGHAPELWRRSEALDAPSEVSVNCTMSFEIGPQIDGMSSGCLLYIPPEDFYRGTIREAISYWNRFATSISELRKSKRTVTYVIQDKNSRMFVGFGDSSINGNAFPFFSRPTENYPAKIAMFDNRADVDMVFSSLTAMIEGNRLMQRSLGRLTVKELEMK